MPRRHGRLPGKGFRDVWSVQVTQADLHSHAIPALALEHTQDARCLGEERPEAARMLIS